MSYLVRHARRRTRRPPPMGNWLDDLVNKGKSIVGKVTGLVSEGENVLDKAKGGLDVAQNVVTDPCFPQVLDLVRQLHTTEQKPLHGVGNYIATGDVPGVGLCKVVKPLKAYIYVKKHPIVIPLAVAAILGIPFLLGYGVGKKRRA